MAEASHSRTDLTANPFTAHLTVASSNRVAPGARQAPPRGAASESLTFRAAISLGSSLRRIEHRVVGIEVDEGTGSVPDPHAALLCLEDGRRIPKIRAITNLRYGVEAYFTERDGVRSRLRVVDPCSRCGEAYLRADEGATQADTLLSLPPCPPGQAPSPSGSEAANLPPPEP